ncbi:hypothetical protein CDD83_7348 [Cordyceps sp. RAO-2017]|nr:hypothetical protein CDD83_7348 [Cordyceps sp. RAO-2017]
MDDDVAFLRDPLTLACPASAGDPMMRHLIIVGGNSFGVARLTSELSAVLRPYCGSISTASSLLDFLGVEMPSGTAVLSLAGLDATVFSELGRAEWDALKKMILYSETLMWVIQDRVSGNPYGSMMPGLLRCALRDNPALDYLLLDIPDAREVNHRLVAEALVRHIAASRWRRQGVLRLTVESELAVDDEGRFHIPRLVMNQDMNDRYNSDRREVGAWAHPDVDNMGVSLSESGWAVSLEAPLRRQEGEGLQLQTTHSLLWAVGVGENCCMFLLAGRDAAGQTRLALSPKNHSLACVQERLSHAVHVSPGSETLLLRLTAQHLLASAALGGLARGEKALVFEPSAEMAAIIAEQAAVAGVGVAFATTAVDDAHNGELSWLVLHPATSERAIARRVANQGFSAFVELGPASGTATQPLRDRIASVLSPSVRRRQDGLVSPQAWCPPSAQLGQIEDRLAKAVAWAGIAVAGPSGGPGWRQVASVPLDHVSSELEPLSVVEWRPARVRLRPVDSQLSFPGDRTYWLVGLSGGLGLSLCEWMAQRGARHFCITSRRPDVDAAWLDDMRAKGVAVTVAPCDVTQRERVRALHAELCSSMPAIAGVAQGVMVLHDTAIQDMTLEQLLSVTRPKVEGSIHLDDLFPRHTLDFFVFLSSATAVVGNNGQANYAAANTFMASLARQRRRRGLAASVLHIGPLVGIGRATRLGKGGGISDIIMRMGGLASTSERQFHQMFAEAVLAGRPGGADADAEIVSGVQPVSRSREERPVWHAWPRMSHLLRGRQQARDEQAATRSHASGRAPIKARLAAARTRQHVYAVVWDVFTRKLDSQFHLKVGQVGEAELGSVRFDQIGIDSLTAVEIRGWFMAELEVQVPVLEILNGVSIGELVAKASQTVPPHLVPSLEGGPTEQTSQQTTADGPPGDLETSATPPGPTQTGSGPVVLRSVPVSPTQARFYPAGRFLDDRTGLNHTAWARFTGTVDVDRLRQAVRALGRQHEILRTAFFDHDGQQMQHVLATSRLHLEHRHIEREQEVAQLAMAIQKEHVYDTAGGETLRLILLTRSPSSNFLIMGVHPLVVDATSVRILLRWLAVHYAHPNLRLPVKQFAEASEQRRAARYDAELRFWRAEFATPPSPLPLLTLARVDRRPELKRYDNVRAAFRVSAPTKALIADACRRRRATPFHFYLAALRGLLLRYAPGGRDVTIAVAEDGRGHDAHDMDVIGCLYNLVLVRLHSQPSAAFEDLLEAARSKVYAALANSKLPYPTLVNELDLQRTAQYWPFFQVFADYRVGQREKMPFGDSNELLMMGFDLNVPYDVYLDIIDEPDGECAHHLFLRSDLFSHSAAERLARSYHRLIEAFAADPAIAVHCVDLSEPADGTLLSGGA